jgi:antitoxin VapB
MVRVSLNIKNERVHALAREAARVRGTTQTAAIAEALEMLLQAHGADPEAARVGAKVEAARRIVEAYAQAPSRPPSITRVEDLYDDDSGLPR